MPVRISTLSAKLKLALFISLNFLFTGHASAQGYPTLNWSHIPALDRPKVCESFKCLDKAMKLERTLINNREGTRTIIRKNSSVEIRLHRNLDLSISDIEVFDLKSGNPISFEKFYDHKRSSLIYDGGDYPKMRVIEGSLSGDNQVYERWVEQLDVSGKTISLSKQAWKRSDRVFRYDTCLRGMEPFDFTTHDLPRLTRRLFDGGEFDEDDIRITNDNCPDTIQEQSRHALEEGLRCMMDPHRGGGHRSSTDAAMLLALMSDPARPFTLRCFSGGAIPGHDPIADGVASMCGDGGSATDTSTVAPYPGINLNLVGLGRHETYTRGTIFHEMLHTLGYPHGHAPDVSYVCGDCCFSEFPTAIKNQACSLCREGFYPGPNYFGRLLAYVEANEELSNTSDRPVITTGLTRAFTIRAIQRYAHEHATSRSSPNVNIINEIIPGIIHGCPHHQIDQCPIETQATVAAFLYAQQIAAQRDGASGGALGVLALTSEQTNMLANLSSTTLNGEQQGLRVIGALHAGYIRSGTSRGARDFVRNSGVCDGLNASTRQSITNVLEYHADQYASYFRGPDDPPFTVSDLCP